MTMTVKVIVVRSKKISTFVIVTLKCFRMPEHLNLIFTDSSTGLKAITTQI